MNVTVTYRHVTVKWVQQFYVFRRRRRNFQTKRPIAKISTLCTLELLILPTGAHFQAIWGNFEGEFLTFLEFIFVCGTPEWPVWQDGQCW